MKFTFYFFILIFLHSEESIPSEHSNIKKLIETNQLQKAKLELGLAMKGNENDPTLNFYQTELWIAEGESYFANGQYKIAMEIYEKAIKEYPSNPLVKSKYKDMVNKVNSVKSKRDIIPVSLLALQGGLSEKNSENQSPTSNLEKLVIGIFLQNILIILLLVFALRKRKV